MTVHKKRAVLLHSRGLPLQFIYFNITGAHKTDADKDDMHDIIIKYFPLKNSSLFEGHIF